MNYKQQGILVGAIMGAGLGALGGYLFVRGLDEAGEDESLAVAAKSVNTGDAFKLIVAILGVLRGIASLRDVS